MRIRYSILVISFLMGRVVFGCSSTRTMIENFDCGAYRHLTVSERLLIARTIESYTHCKMLISNTGLDSRLWMEINKGGQTIFLEHDQFWIDLCTKRFPGIHIIKVEYELLHKQWQEILHEPAYYTLYPRSEEPILSYDYDVIFIDGPESHPTMPTTVDLIGRMQMFFLAAELFFNAEKMVHLFIHDTDREMEQAAADNLIGKSYLICEEGNLRYYRNV